MATSLWLRNIGVYLVITQIFLPANLIQFDCKLIAVWVYCCFIAILNYQSHFSGWLVGRPFTCFPITVFPACELMTLMSVTVPLMVAEVSVSNMTFSKALVSSPASGCRQDANVNHRQPASTGPKSPLSWCSFSRCLATSLEVKVK